MDAPLKPFRAERIAWIWRLFVVRLRFVFFFAAFLVVFSQWQNMVDLWNGLGQRLGGAHGATSPDTEYFCPMDPGVLSAGPSKCPICNMALVRRKKGEVSILPTGVVARMQFSPYRVQLAGIRTSEIAYRRLERERRVEAIVASLDGPKSESPRAGEISLVVAAPVDDGAELALAENAEVRLAGASPSLVGRVVSWAPRQDRQRGALLRLRVDEARDWPRLGERVEVTYREVIADQEPFRSQPRGQPTRRPGDPRQVFVCHDHPEIVRESEGRCPLDQSELHPRLLSAWERVDWWCPTHPRNVADRAGAQCPDCRGMPLAPRVRRHAPVGEVLAVPKEAVIDTGRQRVVFVERHAGMFDGVTIELGPRVGNEYPVVAGLQAGDRVATSGALLLDAETRLNPSLAASYFGASMTSSPSSRPASGSTGNKSSEPPLSPADRDLASKQKICPVTSLPLDAMGGPVPVVIEGRRVLICCAGCESALRKDPRSHLAKLPASLATPAGGTAR